MDALQGILRRIADDSVDGEEKLTLMYKAISFAERAGQETLSSTAATLFLEVIVRGLLSPTRTLRGSVLRLARYYIQPAPASAPASASGNGALLVQAMNRSRIPYLVARSVERYEGVHFERMQAMKLVRRIAEVCPQLMHRALVMAVLAVGESVRDSYSVLAMETLAEITLANPRLATECGAVRVLLEAAVEPAFEAVQKALLSTVVSLYDDPKTRVYVRPSADWRILFAPLSDNIGEAGIDKSAQWKAAARAISEVCCSWTGILALLGDPVCVPSLVASLQLRSVELQTVVLNCFYDLLKLRSMSTADPLRTIRREARMTVSNEPSITQTAVDLPSRSLMERANLLDSYLAIVLVALVDAGLIDALVEVSRAAEDPHGYTELVDASELQLQLRNLGMRAVALLGEVLYLSNSLLPTIHCARLQTLPSLMKYAITFTANAESRSNASSAVWFLHQYAHLKGTAGASNSGMVTALTGANKWRRIKGRDRRLDRIDDVKHMMDVAMDDKQFQMKLQDTQVLITKDYSKWNWDVISETIEGPLHNLNHLLFALQKCKIIKRLLSFLRPSNRLFSQLSYTPANATYVRVACQLIELLMQSDHGATYLQENVLLKELAELLQSELASSGVASSDKGGEKASFAGGASVASLSTGSGGNVAFSSQSGGGGAGGGAGGASGGGTGASSAMSAPLSSTLVGNQSSSNLSGIVGNRGAGGASATAREAFFSPQRVLKTMTREYFSLIGTLSAFQRGLQLLKVFKILTYLRPLMEIPGRDDLSNIILTSLDYNLGGAQSPRLLLLSCLQSQSRVVRFLATRHMRVLLRSNTASFYQWGIDFLVKQLVLDTDAKVRALALAIVDEACDDISCMDSLIEQRGLERPLRDVLPELGKGGKELLMRMLSRPLGYKLLSDSNFIEKELQWWRETGNLQYVASLEESLERAFSATTWKKEAKADVGNGILFLPPHLFGELAKTELGSALLKSSGMIELVLKDLYNTNNLPATRKAALWVVGNVGASDSGLELLRNFKVIDYVVKEARTCSVLSVRGTCFYVLGMLSRTDEGRTRLNALGWESPDVNATVSIPSKVRDSNIFRIRSYDYYGSQWPATAKVLYVGKYTGAEELEAIKLLENISNHITSDSASKALKKLSQTGAPPMASKSLYFDAMQMISVFKYRLPARRFVYDAFTAASLDPAYYLALPAEEVVSTT
jgi:hypothetical protein